MARESLLLMSFLALPVVLIGFANSLSEVGCMQHPDIFSEARSEEFNSMLVEQVLDSVKNKDQIKLGDYSVKEILAIRDQTVDACRSFNTSYHHGVLEYHSSNEILFDYYREKYLKLIDWCVSNSDSYLDAVLSGITDEENKILKTWTKKLPERYWYMSEVSVNEAVESYLREARSDRTMSSQLEQGLRAELESTCRHILKETDIFQEMRHKESWHKTTTANGKLASFDQLQMACKIYLDKSA